MAWAVAFYHLGLLSGASHGGGRAASVAAVLGLHSVEAFFVISGFCFFHIYRGARFDAASYCRFQLQRLLRIAPLFYLALAANLAFGLAAGPPFSWRYLLENLSFSFGLIHPNHALVTGGWSIGLEFVFYLVFPLLVGLGRSLLLLLVAAGGLAWVAALYSAQHVAAAPDFARFNAYVLLPNHAFAFALGALLAGLRARTRWRLSPLLAFAALGCGLAVWASAAPSIVDHFEIVLGPTRARYVAASATIVLLFAFTQGGSPRLRALLGGLGELSYPVYLLHPFAWALTRSWLPPSAPPGLALAAALATTLGFAMAARRYLERPLARLRARLASAPPRSRSVRVHAAAQSAP